jgi:type IV secretory pathway TrbF-like protein
MRSHESECYKAYSYARERYFAVLQAYVKNTDSVGAIVLSTSVIVGMASVIN